MLHRAAPWCGARRPQRRSERLHLAPVHPRPTRSGYIVSFNTDASSTVDPRKTTRAVDDDLRDAIAERILDRSAEVTIETLRENLPTAAGRHRRREVGAGPRLLRRQEDVRRRKSRAPTSAVVQMHTSEQFGELDRANRAHPGAVPCPRDVGSGTGARRSAGSARARSADQNVVRAREGEAAEGQSRQRDESRKSEDEGR